MIDDKCDKVILVNDVKIRTDEELQKLNDISSNYSNAIFFTERTYNEDTHTDLNIYANGKEYVKVRQVDPDSFQVTMGTNNEKLELSLNPNTGQLYFGVDTSDVIIMRSDKYAAVLNVCYENNWCASPDKMTKAEAEAVTVTDIGRKFQGNTEITRFNTFKYFTGITSIPSYAFEGCENLIEITLPEGLTEFGSYSFMNCGSLSKINNLSSITKIGQSCFEGCSKIDNDIIFKSALGSIPNRVFFGARNIKSVTIEDGITNIGSYILSRNEIITELTIPDSVTAVKASTYLMQNLEKLTLPKDYDTLYSGMFRYCNALSTIVNYPEEWKLPNNVTSIAACFENCDVFSRPVKIAEGLETLGKYFFREARSISRVELPSTLKTIEPGAFANAYNISVLIINANKAPELNINVEAKGITDFFYNMGKDAATRTLYVPAGATGYNEGEWLTLQTRENYPFELKEL